MFDSSRSVAFRLPILLVLVAALLAFCGVTAAVAGAASDAPSAKVKAKGKGKNASATITITAPAGKVMGEMIITLSKGLTLNKPAFKSPATIDKYVDVKADGAKLPATCIKRKSATKLDLTSCGLSAAKVVVVFKKGSLTASKTFKASKPAPPKVSATTQVPPPSPPTGAAPTVAITSPASGVTTSASANVAFTATGTAPMTCKIGAATVTSPAIVALSVGTNEIQVVCTNAFGTGSSTTITITRGIAATVDVTTAGGSTSDSSVQINFDSAGTAPVTCTYENSNGGGTGSIASGNSVSLNQGANVISVTCTNVFGSATDTVTITRGTPAGVTVNDVDQNTTASTFVVDYAATGTSPACTVSSDRSHTGNPIALEFGANVITVSCGNAFGSTATGSVTVTRGTAAGVTVNDADQNTTASTFNVDYAATGTNPSCSVSSDRSHTGNPIALELGANVITVSCDNDFASPASDSVTVTRGTSATVEITTSGGDTSNSSEPVEFTTGGTAPVTCTVTNNGGSASPITSGGSVGLVSGSNHIVVTCSNGFGAAATDSIDFTAGLTPSVVITSLAEGQNVTSPVALTYTVDGQGSIPGGTTCTVNGDGSTSTSESLTYGDGEHTITVICTNTYGPGQAQVTVTVGTTAGVNVNDADQNTAAGTFNVDYTATGTSPICSVSSDRSHTGNPIDLELGANVITVSCDNDFGPPATDSVTVTRGTPAGVTVNDSDQDTSATTFNVDYTATGTSPICTVSSDRSHTGNPIDLDLGANVITVSCDNDFGPPATSSVTVTRVPAVVLPDTSITQYGNPSTGGFLAPAISVEFSGTESPTGYECAVAHAPNGAASYDTTNFESTIAPVDWTSCSSAWEVPTGALASENQYMYLVRAVNGSGHDASPAKGFFWYDEREFNASASLAYYTNTLAETQASTDDARQHPTLGTTVLVEGADDGQSVDIVMPDGLMGSLKAIPQANRCDLSSFQTLETCPASSKIGELSGTAIGSVDGEVSAVGDLFLIDPDSLGSQLPGAAAGVALVIDNIQAPITANPGKILAIGGLYINDNGMNIRVKVDDIPNATSEGLRFHATEVTLKINGDTRPDMDSPASASNPALITNPSQCNPLLVDGDLLPTRQYWNQFYGSGTGYYGSVSPTITVDYPVDNCEGLPAFEPTVDITTDPSPLVASTAGNTQDLSLTSNVNFGDGQAGVSNATVYMPPYISTNLGGFGSADDQCTPLTIVVDPDGTENFDPTVDTGCPPQARVGTAQIQSPLVDGTITADVWLIDNGAVPQLGLTVDEDTPGNPRGVNVGFVVHTATASATDRAYPTVGMLTAAGYTAGDGMCVATHDQQRLSRCRATIYAYISNGGVPDMPLTSMDLTIGNVGGRVDVNSNPLSRPLRSASASDPVCRTEFYPGGSTTTSPYSPIASSFFDSAAQLGAWSGEVSPESNSDIPITGCTSVLQPPAITAGSRSGTSGTVTFNYSTRTVATGLTTECSRDSTTVYSTADCGTISGTATGSFTWPSVTAGSGSHTFRARVRDVNGNTSNPTTWTWTA